MKKSESKIVIYKNIKKTVEVELKDNDIWLNLKQISEVFDRDKSVISRHLNNIFKEEELERKSVVAKNATTASDGKTYQVEYFNLDAIISVGYRVNSKVGTKFRQWATKILKEHLVQGFTINSQKFEKNAQELEVALELVRKASKKPDLLADEGKGLVDVITRYTKSFLLLQKYDEGLLENLQGKNGGEFANIVQIRKKLQNLKNDLIAKKEATNLFAAERGDALAAIFGNLRQTIFGKEAYPTIEEKAAHLLYFIVKNHPFTDGNKRSAAFLFVDFLNNNNRLFDSDGQIIINEIGLAALTLLIAESNPKNKDLMIKLVINMLSLENC